MMLILFPQRKSIKKNFVFASKRQRFQGFAPGNETKQQYQKSALPTVRGCSSTSRMFDTPVRYMTMRSKPRPKPA